MGYMHFMRTGKVIRDHFSHVIFCYMGDQDCVIIDDGGEYTLYIVEIMLKGQKLMCFLKNKGKKYYISIVM